MLRPVVATQVRYPHFSRHGYPRAIGPRRPLVPLIAAAGATHDNRRPAHDPERRRRPPPRAIAQTLTATPSRAAASAGATASEKR